MVSLGSVLDSEKLVPGTFRVADPSRGVHLGFGERKTLGFSGLLSVVLENILSQECLWLCGCLGLWTSSCLFRSERIEFELESSIYCLKECLWLCSWPWVVDLFLSFSV